MSARPNINVDSFLFGLCSGIALGMWIVCIIIMLFYTSNKDVALKTDAYYSPNTNQLVFKSQERLHD